MRIIQSRFFRVVAASFVGFYAVDAIADDTSTTRKATIFINLFMDFVGSDLVSGFCVTGCEKAKIIYEQGKKLTATDNQIKMLMGKPVTAEQARNHQMVKDCLAKGAC